MLRHIVSVSDITLFVYFLVANLILNSIELEIILPYLLKQGA